MFCSAEIVNPSTLSLYNIRKYFFIQNCYVYIVVFLCAERGFIMQGIYEIHCCKSGKKYIGSSKNIHKRWNSHISALRCGNHHNYYLQQAYIRYGEDNLVFSVLEIVDNVDDLYAAEEAYIKRFKFSKLFNSLRKPGEIPKRKSRWMSFCEKNKRGKKDGRKEEWAWGD